MAKNFLLFLLLLVCLCLWFPLAKSNAVRAQTMPSGIIGLPEPQYCDSLGLAGTNYVRGLNCRIVSVDDYPRAYIVYVPYNVQDPAPVVFMFHGSSGDGLQYLSISGWREKADEEGVVIIFPTGLVYCKLSFPCENGGQAGWTTRWHDYSLQSDPEINWEILPPGYPATSPWPVDDLQFTRQILNDLYNQATAVAVNSDRIYASGFSNGANFTARLAVELSEQLAAVGYVAGGLADDAVDVAQPAIHIPVYAAFGNQDARILAEITSEEIEALPLQPASLFAIPEIREGFITPHLDGFEHAYKIDTLRPYTVRQFQNNTLLRWHSPQVGGPQHIFQMAVLEGLEHKYPNGCHPKNLHCFSAADTFWSFFQNGPDSDLGHGFLTKPLQP